MEVSPEYHYLQPRPSLILTFRIVGQIGIVLIALLFPAVGEYRYLLAGIVLMVTLPMTVWVSLRCDEEKRGWLEPLHDLLWTVALIHFVPDVWVAGLCIGLVIAMAPSVSLHPRSYRIYSLFGVILLGGMTLAAVVHQVEDSLLPLLAVTAIYPSVVFYAHWQVRRADALRERSQLLQSMTHLAGSVAHDFNNVLAGVSGHAELALAELPENHSASAALREVINGASRASLLCGQLLSFSKLAPGSQQLDLNKEVDMLVALLEPVVPKGVRFVVEHAAPDIWVSADRSQLQQVIMNVILNAGEASANLPALVGITVMMHRRDGADWAVIEVRDSGEGIDAKDLDRVFDPFYTTKEKGHGLGLAGARRIMRAHGGDITLTSLQGVGTTATLKMPLGASEQPRSNPILDEEGLVPANGGVVLIVDDEATVRDVVARLLAHIGYDNVTAENGQAAVDRFRQGAEEIVAVILDLKMPGMDGWRCLELLREIRSDVPVLVCSGYDPEDRVTSELPANVRYLSKPFRSRELQSALLELDSQ